MKLYVVTHKDLSGPQKAIQAGHAIAEFMRKYPNNEWNCGSLVYLEVLDEYELDELFFEIAMVKEVYAGFNEPFFDDSLTAIAILGTPKIVEKLKKYPLMT